MTAHPRVHFRDPPLSWDRREVPLAFLAATGCSADCFVHLTPETHPMARYIIGFGGCPHWRDPGHRAGSDLLLTLWLTPDTARCTVCFYVETLAAFMARLGWGDPQ